MSLGGALMIDDLATSARHLHVNYNCPMNGTEMFSGKNCLNYTVKQTVKCVNLLSLKKILTNTRYGTCVN